MIDIDIYNDKFTIEKTYDMYLKEIEEIREKRKKEIGDMSERLYYYVVRY